MATLFKRPTALIRPVAVMADALLAALLMVVVYPAAGRATEPRPWLCRDLPAFSSREPMVYRATARSPRRWRLSLLQFQQGAPHDNLVVETSRPLDQRHAVSGRLAPGTYYAVAQYAGPQGHWICPARSEDESASGYLASFCFSDPAGGCAVRMRVKSASPR